MIAFEAHPLVYARYAPAMKEAGSRICSVLCGGSRGSEMILKVTKKDGREKPKMVSLLGNSMAAE